MAWEISVGPEAWGEIRENLEKIDYDTLVEVLISNLQADTRKLVQEMVRDRFADTEELLTLSYLEDMVELPDYYLPKKMSLQQLPKDILEDRVFEGIEKHRTCSNGGHLIYLDSEGWYRMDWDGNLK